MYKRIISICIIIALFMSLSIPYSIFADAKSENLTMPKGVDVIWNFDNSNAVSAEDTKWISGLQNSLFLEENSQNVYGDMGKSLKWEHQYYKSIMCCENGLRLSEYDGIAVWIKSDKEMTVDLYGLVNGWSSTGSIKAELNVGENIVIFEFMDMISGGASVAKVNTMNQMQIRSLTNTTGTLWIDSIGYYTKTQEEPPTISEIPEGGDIKWTFDNSETVSAEDTKWISGKADSLSLEENIENVYGNSGKSLKWQHSYYKTVMCTESVNVTDYEGVVAWIKSEKDMTVDLYGLINGWSNTGSIVRKLKAGVNIVIFNFEDIVMNGAAVNKVYSINQMQIRSLTNKTGTMWIDSVGFYKAPMPVDPEYNVPETPAIHAVGFYEVAPVNNKWTLNDKTISQFNAYSDASRYYSGGTNIGKNKSSLRLNYKELSDAGKIQIAYNGDINIGKLQDELKNEDSILSLWVWSSQKARIKLSYEMAEMVSGSVICSPGIIDISAGEGILKIPMKNLIPAGKDVKWEKISNLKITVLPCTDSVKEGLIYFDTLGFYNAGFKVNDESVPLSDDSFVWWDFDQYENLNMLGTDWEKHWAGTDGDGIILSMEDDINNVYGKNGRSLKVVYDRARGDWNAPGIWHAELMTTYGNGFTFWIKSNEKTSFNLICLDAKYRGVIVKNISLNIGENVVEVPYSAFEFMEAVENDKPQMNRVTQLQLRMSGCDYGTIWFDSFGYLGIKNDNSNSSKLLLPPDKYDSFEEGKQSSGDDFESWSGDDDLDFCTDWYFEQYGWIALEKQSGNTVLRMDYDMTEKTSVLKNITSFEGVDPNGGISFWAKSSEERNYCISIDLGDHTIMTVIKATPNGRYYKIPFKEFLESSNINISFEPDSKNLVKVTAIRFETSNTYNPPAVDASEKCNLWLDDIAFVDSLSYKRADDINYYENGVRLIAEKAAFSSGVNPRFSVLPLNAAQKTDYIGQMNGASVIDHMVSINVFDSVGISAVPNLAVELIFDIPAGKTAENTAVYQSYIDGSVMKVSTNIGSDGKLHANVYRLGDFILADGNYLTLGENSLSDNYLTDESPETGDRRNIAFALVAVVAASFLTVILNKKLSEGRINEYK